MKLPFYLWLFVNLSIHLGCKGQSAAPTWKNKQCAVALTYDDALNVHLDNAIPLLDSLHLKATFYLIGASPVVANRIEAWRKAAKKGHELGNHSLFHPCDGSLPGRGFVTAENDLSTYSVARAVNEIRACNALLKAIDGKEARTFAYPCGDTKIGDSLFYTSLRKDFVGARGVRSGLQSMEDIQLDDIHCFAVNQHTAEEMIDAVKKATISHSLLIFLFHGVGGEHSLNVALKEHAKLLRYLKANEQQIWVAPVVEIATYIRAQQQKQK